MKCLTYLSYALLALPSLSTAHPGMDSTMASVRREANKVKRADSKLLIGDLKTLKDSQLTPLAKDIKAILLDQLSAESSIIDNSIPAGALGSAACKADLCCVWKWISYEMTAKFNGTSGRCTKLARQAVRLGFHDAGAWSNTSAYGGADGSILLTDEISRADNNGLSAIADQTKAWYTKYAPHGASMADLIQMGATVATVVCPLGPRIRSFVGRRDNARAAPTGLLPGHTDSADALLKLFAAKTIDAHDLVALVGAHTTSQQHFVDPARAGDPQDSSPGVWDVKFYPETTASSNSIAPRVLKFQSDVNLSKDPRSAGEWREFSSPADGQEHWNEDYAKAYTRLSLLGVGNINELGECTRVLPPRRKSYAAEDQVVLDLWLGGQFDQLSDLVDGAIMLTGVGTGGSGTVITP